LRPHLPDLPAKARDQATIPPERTDQLAGRRRRRERPCGFDRSSYRRRNVVERCFHRLKQWRGLAIRYDKRPPTATSPPSPSPAHSSGSTHDRQDTPP
ncbi:transposase, partial [Streptomyces sp. SID7803]|nr:transposase [Streptomyces sp. SID7803]